MGWATNDMKRPSQVAQSKRIDDEQQTGYWAEAKGKNITEIKERGTRRRFEPADWCRVDRAPVSKLLMATCNHNVLIFPPPSSLLQWTPSYSFS